MGALAKVFVEVEPDTRRFGPQVKRELGSINVSSEGHKVGSTFVSGAKSSFGALAKVAAVSFAAIGAGAFKAGSFGLKIASQNEQAQISFETMLGSASKAQKFLGDLQKFAAKTPFEFPELQTAASSLISVGVDARKVIPIMTSLGNATAGMGTGSEGVKRATVALQQMSAAGKITGEDLNQLRDAGVPVFDLLAAATGKSKAKVAELAQAGKLGKKELDQLFKALETGKGLERFSGLMDKQSASLSGMLSTFKDTFGQGMANAIAPALPTIKRGLQAASDQAGHFFNVLSGKGTAKDFAATTGQIALGLRAMVAAFKEGDVTSDGLVGKFEKAGVAARQFRFGVLALIAAYKEGDVTSDGFVGAMERIGVQLRKAHDWIAAADFHSLAGDTKELGAQAKGLDFSRIVAQLKGIDTKPLGDGLHVAGAGVKFLADHLGLLVKALPVIIALFIAYKAAQSAANVAELASIPVKAAQVVSNLVLARSIKALAASNVQNTVATGAATVASTVNAAVTNAGTAAIERGRFATIASAVAQKAVRGATLLWTGAQWLLNVALSANPIGLLVVGIAALIAIIVVVATRTRFFQTVWAVAWRGIKAAFDVVYGWIKAHWPLILGILTGPVGAAVILIVRNWDRIKTTAVGLWNTLRSVWQTGVRFIVGLFLTMVGTVVNGAARAFGWVPKLGDKLKKAASDFNGFKDSVNRSLSGVKSRTVTVTAALVASQAAARTQGGNSGTGGSNIRFATGGPVFGSGTATSDSIPALLSNGEHVLTAKEVRAFGGHAMVQQMRKDVVKGFAAGGMVRAEDGSLVPTSFYNRTSKTRVPAGMVRAEDGSLVPTSFYAGRGLNVRPRLSGSDQFGRSITAFNSRVDALARKLAAAQAGPSSPGLNGAVQFARSQAGKPYVWGASGPGGYDCSGFVSALVNVVQGRSPYSRRFSTGTLPAGLFAPGRGAFNIGWFRGNPGHVAATVNGVPMESRGGDGVVVGSRSRGADQGIFTQHGHLKGFARGGRVPRIPGRIGGNAFRVNHFLGRMDDHRRDLYRRLYGLPPAPRGWAWAEDESLVRRSFFRRRAAAPSHRGMVQAEDGSWVPRSFYGFASGGPVLPGDPPFDILDPRGRHYKPGMSGLLAALQGVRTYDSGGDMPPGVGVYRNNTGRTETVTTAKTMDAVVAELRALRAAVTAQPLVVEMDGRPMARAVRNQNTRNSSGW